jgi:hypothetical protein
MLQFHMSNTPQFAVSFWICSLHSSLVGDRFLQPDLIWFPSCSGLNTCERSLSHKQTKGPICCFSIYLYILYNGQIIVIYIYIYIES